MFTKRSLYRLTVLALLIATACAPHAAPASTPAASVATMTLPAPGAKITLNLAVADDEGGLTDPLVREFVEQAKTLSNGNITVEPVWNAGADTQAGFEKGVIELVRTGKADLGLAASRSWDPQVFPNLQVLQAPFLITNDTLAEAVATSDAATQMLDSLSAGGVVGLTLWPEDLRHPFSVDPAKPLISPNEFAGLDIRTTDTGMSERLIKALGGNPIFEASNYQGAESGLRQGPTLTGRPAATGNVTFFPKYQVLFANGEVFEGLSEEQRGILRQAAAATQSKAIAEHPSESDNGAAWCADGGTIVLASDKQVAAFETAAQPVYEAIAQDASNAKLIAAIRDLKAKTPPSAGAAACEAASAQSTSAPAADAQVWSKDLIPDGVWQTTLSPEDLMAVGGIRQSAANEQAGTHTFTFHNGKVTWTLEGDNTGYCEGTYALVGDVTRITFTNDCAPELDDVQWRLDDQGLHFRLAAIQNAPFAEIRANWEAKPFQKIGE